MKITILVLLNLDIKNKRLSIDSINWSKWVIKLKKKKTQTWGRIREVRVDPGDKGRRPGR